MSVPPSTSPAELLVWLQQVLPEGWKPRAADVLNSLVGESFLTIDAIQRASTEELRLCIIDGKPLPGGVISALRGSKDTNDKQTKNQGDLEAQNHELIRKLMVATLKNEELELKNRQLTSSGKIMQILTQSSATIYRALCPEKSSDVFRDIPPVSATIVEEVWKEIVRRKLITPASGTKEKKFQKIFEEVMEVIEEFVPSHMVFYAKPNLVSKIYNGAVTIPDGIFNHECVLPTYDMTTVSVEVKPWQTGSFSYVHQGVGDTIHHTFNTIFEQHGRENAVEAEGFGVFTDVATVSVLRVTKGFQVEHSEHLPLLPDDAKYGAAPEGLIALIRLYAAPPSSLGNHFPPVVKKVVIGQQEHGPYEIAVDCYVGSGTNTVVYAAQNKSEATAVKLSTQLDNTFKWQSRVAREIAVLTTLQPIGCKHVPQVADLQKQVTNFHALCTTPVGLPLRTSDKLTQQPTVMWMVVDGVTSALAAAQTRGLCHNDIHPGNVIVAGVSLNSAIAEDLNTQEHHICLVDWELALSVGSIRNRFTGVALYISDKILEAQEAAICNCEDDFESLIYLCVYLYTGGRVPWAEAANLEQLVTKRREYMRKLENPEGGQEEEEKKKQRQLILQLWSLKDKKPFEYEAIRIELKLPFVNTEKRKSIRSRRKALQLTSTSNTTTTTTS